MADVPIDESLISGFLSAISTFGAEIGSKIQDAKGGLEELSYRQFKIIVNEGKIARTALLLLKRPSETLRTKLKRFNDAFEKEFGRFLEKFSGKVLEDMKVTPLIEEIFEADLLYPHQVVDQKAKDYLKQSSKKELTRKILITARSEDFESSFYLRDMINHLKTKGIEEIESFESLQKLKSKKVVFAINPRTNYLIEQFQPIIKALDEDDRSILFAVFEGANNEMAIRKYLKKKHMDISKEISDALTKLRELNLIDESINCTEIGNGLATLLNLIPDL